MNREKLEQLVERWRSDAESLLERRDACTDHRERMRFEFAAGRVRGCAGELAALLVANDGSLLAEEAPTDKSLPLMARREWMPTNHDTACVLPDGYIYTTCDGPSGCNGTAYRIVSHDEHGLPVVPRTADMPAVAKYRTGTDQGAYIAYFSDAPVYYIGTLQRIEDYTENSND